MQGLTIWFERSEAKLPGQVTMTMDYEVANRLYEFVKREMEGKRDYYRYAKRGEGKSTPDSVIRSLERDLDAFAVIYKGVVDAYRNREEI